MLDVAPELADRVCLGVVRADGVVVRDEAPDVWAEVDRVTAEMRARHGGKAPADIPELQPARELYRRTGADPTKVRPSSEALLRRVLRGEALYRINSLVDAINLCSLEFLLPIGLYDADRIVGPVTARLGRPGEAYESLGKGVFSVAGRLALFDDRGPFGGPTNDSRRTAVTEQTTRCLAVIFAPGSYPARRMQDHVQHTTRRLREFAQAARVESAVVGGR